MYSEGSLCLPAAWGQAVVGVPGDAGSGGSRHGRQMDGTDSGGRAEVVSWERAGCGKEAAGAVLGVTVNAEHQCPGTLSLGPYEPREPQSLGDTVLWLLLRLQSSCLGSK